MGDPRAEYDAASNRVAVLQRDDRALVRVYGRDPLRIIQGIVTNDVTGASPDRAVYAAFLTPKGRMLADVRVIRTTGSDPKQPLELLLDVPRAALDALLDTFRRTIPPLFARFEDVTANYHLVSLYGPDALDAARTITGLAPSAVRDAYALARVGDLDVHMITTQDTGCAGADFIFEGDVSALVETAESIRATRIGTSTYDVLRIEAGTPAWGAELTDATIPLEADLMSRAISTNKGCYTGQEVIVRILHRGHVNWKLSGFMMGDIPTPATGQTLVGAGGKNVARITSAAYSPRFKQVIGLGYTRRELELPATLHMSGDEDTVVTAVTLPFQTNSTTSNISSGASS
jgi:folate-binding protein YgfZ